MKTTIKVGGDFSGVGAFNQALMRLGINYQEVFACDMDKYARQTFIHNYGEPDYYPMNVYDRVSRRYARLVKKPTSFKNQLTELSNRT